jgi:hypothetical protein
MAEYGEPGEPAKFIPPITQETLAEMVGTTRSRVGLFINRFRKLGFIDYNGRIQVHKSFLNAVLHDRLPEHNPQSPRLAPKLKISPDRPLLNFKTKPVPTCLPAPLQQKLALQEGPMGQAVPASFQE